MAGGLARLAAQNQTAWKSFWAHRCEDIESSKQVYQRLEKHPQVQSNLRVDGNLRFPWPSVAKQKHVPGPTTGVRMLGVIHFRSIAEDITVLIPAS